MFDRIFRLSENGTNVRTEVLAGTTTFLTMAYIIFVQPAVLSGAMFGQATGMDFGAVTTATCLSAALASAIMGLYARYPIAQAPGMGENFFFVLTMLPAAAAAFAPQIAAGETTAWQIGLGVVFVSGALFLGLSLMGVREAVLDAISPALRDGIAVGIGLFIAFIGLQNAGVIVKDPGTAVKLNTHFASPDLLVFFFGLLLTGGLHARKVRGAVLWGILAAAVFALVARWWMVPALPEAWRQSELISHSRLLTQFHPPTDGQLFAAPPDVRPTLAQLDLRHALSRPMIPFILIFLFMLMFDTVGTLVGVARHAGFIKENRLPRARQAFVSDAVGTVAGAVFGTSTVTSYIESAAGVEQGGRTGLTAVVVALLFLAALFFGPLIAMVGSYPPITAPALVIVGAMMISGAARIAWDDYAESLPAFLIMIGIPLSYSIADGLALGFIAYPIIKLAAGQGRDVRPLMYVVAAAFIAYFVWLRV